MPFPVRPPRLIPEEAKRMRFALALWFGLSALSLGCGGSHSASTEVALVDEAASAEDPVWFRDDTAQVGLDFVHEAGPVGRYFMPQSMGSGAALLDYDKDGRFDLYLIQNGGPGSPARNKLYHQRSDGRFEDVSAGSGLDIAGYGMGVAVGDIDNDGFVDVYVSQYGGGRLFRNRGNGTFEDITDSAGVQTLSWGTSAAFVDYDRDGWLDLIVVNYVDYDAALVCAPANGQRDYCHPRNFAGAAAHLFHNRGRDAHGRWLGFEDVTHKAGLGKPGPGLGVVCADFNGDGWPDILVANDSAANHLWINRHDGTFVDEAVTQGLAFNNMGQTQANMGIALADVFGSGRFDVFVTHLTEETHTLWHPSAAGAYEDRTISSGLANPRWHGTGFGAILVDFDLDGAPDLAIVNGRVARKPAAPSADVKVDPYWAPYAERNQLFVNDGQGKFRDISPSNKAFCGAYGVCRGLVWGDFDGDGRVDLVATAVAGPARFYRNVAPRNGHWLMVRAVDPALHRDAYGAVVTVQSRARRWIGAINPGQSYLCSGDPRAHFGLGSVTSFDLLRVLWPDGQAEEFPGGGVDRVITLERGRGRKATP
jgi:hypothetical protein